MFVAQTKIDINYSLCSGLCDDELFSTRRSEMSAVAGSLACHMMKTGESTDSLRHIPFKGV